jgi:hypothetical protein
VSNFEKAEIDGNFIGVAIMAHTKQGPAAIK